VLARRLIERGHRVDAVVSRHGPLAGDLRELGAGVLALDLHPEIVAVGADARAFRALCAILRHKHFDVVHTHQSKAGVIGRLAARVSGVPLVHSPHGFAYLTQHWRDRPAQGVRRKLTWGVERALAPLADAIIFASHADREQTIRDGVATGERLVVVHNGIEPPPAVTPDPRLAAREGAPPLIGFLARLTEEKAPLTLLEALSRLRDRGVSFRAALVGSGPLEGATRDRVAELRLGDRVTVLQFPGRVDAALAAFDLYVLPSLWESLPIGVLEAMAARLPVVASDVGGVSEAVAHEETGLLVPPAAVEALADALERLVREDGTRRAMGAAGRHAVIDHFGVERMVAETEHVYRQASR
jgi:glycosyltransferase involved in cell wall biosynthesis